MTQEDKLSAIRAEIEKAMAQEMAAYKIACEHGWGEFSHAPSVYTRLQMIRSFIDSLQKKSKLANSAKSSKNLQKEPASDSPYPDIAGTLLEFVDEWKSNEANRPALPHIYADIIRKQLCKSSKDLQEVVP